MAGRVSNFVVSIRLGPDEIHPWDSPLYIPKTGDRCFPTYFHRVVNGLKIYFNLSWMRVRISYHRFNNLAELLNGNLATKIGCGILSKDLMYT